MPGLNTCCCFKSVKSGSYACGIYTLIFYTVLFIAGTCHVTTVSESPSMIGICVVMVILSAICIVCSVIMIIGLWTDDRILLLPWTVSVAMTTLIDVMLSFYLIRDAITEPFLAVLFVTDVLICGLNVYVLLCVLSQYQEYKMRDIALNVIQPRHQATAQEPQRKAHVTSSVTDDVTSSNALLLPPVSPMKVPPGSNNSTPGKVVCELTTISEEKHTPTPPTPNQLTAMASGSIVCEL